jgi:protocatechuate 3,4-dioxygenase beta subunit
VLDGDDDPVAGVRVEVPANAQTAGDQTFATQTGDDGSYTLDVDLTASTNLTVRAVSGETNVEKIITAFPDQSQSGVDLVLGASTATVSGSVTDGDADAVDDARVETTVGGETFSTQTEASGDYTLNVQIAGSMELTVRAVSDDRQAEQTVTVAPGETDEGINFVLGSSTGGGTATVTGQVTDSQENPVVDARIEVENTDQTIGDQPFTTLTGDDGQYSLDVELRSSAEVTVQAVRDDLGATKTVTLVPGQTRSDIDFVLGGSTEDSGVATVSGRVTSDGDPVSGARIAALPNEQTVSDQPVTTRTESDGTYTLDVEITASTDLTVRASSDGREAEQVVTVFPGDTRSDVDFSFATGGGGDDDGDDGNDGPSGTPSNILLLDVSRTVIGIQGSGSPETARVTYQVADSSGQAVSLDNETPVRFELSGASPDGAFVAPAEATTNDQGEVTVNVSSGLRSGTIQIVATAETSDGTIIESRPITITIHGGLPDQEHFSISPARANFQGLATNGITNPVEVIVGDQYSNPVKPGTAVYFESTHGIIEGSATTDDQGRGTVQLISGNPKPENGVSVVTASTQNRDGNRIEVKTPVLFTSRGILKVVSIPTETFSEPLDLRQREDVETLKEALGSDFPFGGYEFVVEDRNGNPLPQGTTVGFDAGGTEVGASGDTDVTLSDTDVIDDEGDGFDYDDVVRGFGITRFSAAAVRANDPETVEPPDLETVTFRFAGPQGQRAYTFSEPAEGEAASVVVYKDGEPVARF